ncbi:hypothetical protein E4U55_004525 [Claviceps digitariae]|nr:hypothetical protein E4U55_004525 [Claviceps digitariae]
MLQPCVDLLQPCVDSLQPCVSAKAAVLLRFMRQIYGQDARSPTIQNADGHDASLAPPERCSRRENGSLLESLAPELRLELLLHMPDLKTLHSFIHASPFFYAQYRYNEHMILSFFLNRDLDGFFVDAYATMRTRPRQLKKLGKYVTNEHVLDILKEYQTWLSDPLSTPDLLSVDLDSLRWMAAYHRDVVEPMVDEYFRWAVKNMNSALSSTYSPKLARPARKLTRSEQIRISRAMYRFATFHHLFGNHGKRSHDRTVTRHGRFKEFEVNAIFFGVFDPWEAEAIDCIDLFAKAKYRLICKEVLWDFYDRNPKFIQYTGIFRPFDPFNSVECQTLEHQLIQEGKNRLDATSETILNSKMLTICGSGLICEAVSRGLRRMADVLAIDDHEKLVARMDKDFNDLNGAESTVCRGLSRLAQYRRWESREKYASRKDQLQQDRTAMQFTGDGIPLKGPPFAWVALWKGKYANLNGALLPRPLRDIGYVMWDADRWPEGAQELISGYWKVDPEIPRGIKRKWNWSPVEDDEEE